MHATTEDGPLRVLQRMPATPGHGERVQAPRPHAFCKLQVVPQLRSRRHTRCRPATIAVDPPLIPTRLRARPRPSPTAPNNRPDRTPNLPACTPSPARRAPHLRRQAGPRPQEPELQHDWQPRMRGSRVQGGRMRHGEGRREVGRGRCRSTEASVMKLTQD